MTGQIRPDAVDTVWWYEPLGVCVTVRPACLIRGGLPARGARLRTRFALALLTTAACAGGSSSDDDDDDDIGGPGSGDWGDPEYDPDCSQAGAFINGGERHDDVESAVDASTSGDVITVCPGTWATHLDVVHDLTIEGTGDPELTVLDGAGEPGSIVRVTGDTTVTLARLTLRDGQGSDAGNGSTGGGGVRAEGAALVLRSLVFEDNGGDFGSAIASDGPVEGSLLVIEGGRTNSISVASSTDAASLSLEDSVIRGQISDDCLVATGIPVHLERVEIASCPATPVGLSGVEVSLKEVTLTGGGTGRSGGVELFASAGVLEDLVVTGGDSTGGGALTVTQPGDGEIVVRGGLLSGSEGREASAVYLEFQPADAATVRFEAVDFGDGGDSPTLSWETVNGGSGELDLSGITDLSCDRAGCD